MRWISLIPAFLLLMISIAIGDVAPTTQPARAVVTVRMLGSGEPISAAKVKWSGDNNLKGSGETNADGQCVIDGVSNPSQWMDVHVAKDGFVSLRIYWNTDRARDSKNTFPSGFEFQMEKGKPIGGQVVDESAKPIVGATVVVSVGKKYPESQQEIDLSWKKIKTGVFGPAEK